MDRLGHPIDRWKAGSNTDEANIQGNWERPIWFIYRTTDTYVVQSKQQQQKQSSAENIGSTSSALNSTTIASSSSTGVNIGVNVDVDVDVDVGAILWFGPSSRIRNSIYTLHCGSVRHPSLLPIGTSSGL